MRKQFLLGPLLALALPAAAQHTELIGRAGLGLFRFGGRAAARVAGVSYYDDYFDGPGGSGYSPYGRRLGAGFTLGGRGQRVGRRNGLAALEVGYDWLRSRMAVDLVSYSPAIYSSRGPVGYAADGTVQLRTQHLTAFLGLGHRFQVAAAELDLLAGPEVAYVFGGREQGNGTYNGGTPWTINQDNRGSFNRADARLRADLTAWYQRVGLTASYAHGLINYQGGLVGASREVYSRTLRLGLAYRLR